MQVWKLSESWDFTQTVITAHLPQGKLKHSKFSGKTSYAQELIDRGHSWVLSSRATGEKKLSLLVQHKSRKAFIKTLKSRYEVATYLCGERWSWGLQSKSTAELSTPRGCALNQTDWLRDSTWPYCTRFAAMETEIPSSGLTLDIKQCSSTITFSFCPR